jgi:hypothetical protein
MMNLIITRLKYQITKSTEEENNLAKVKKSDIIKGAFNLALRNYAMNYI